MIALLHVVVKKIKDDVASLTQESYNQTVGVLVQFKFSAIKCPKCGRIGAFHIHAYYYRYYGDTNPIRLRVMRIQCNECASTHALLPDAMIAYQTLPLRTVLEIIHARKNLHLSYPQIERLYGISKRNCHRVIKGFEKDHKDFHIKLYKQLDYIIHLTTDDLSTYFDQLELLYLVNIKRLKKLHYSLHSLSFLPLDAP